MRLIIIVPTNRLEDWNNIRNNLDRQTMKPDVLITVENGHSFSWTKATHVLKSPPDVGLARQVGVDFARKNYLGDFIVMMDGDDYYGKNYISECWEHRHKASIIGKHCVFYWLSASKKLAIATGYENQVSTIVHGPTMSFIIDKDVIDFEACPGWGEDLGWQKKMLAKGATIFATSKYNFTGMRHEDINKHTWFMPELAVAGAMKLESIVSEATEENKFKFCEKEIDFSLEASPKFCVNV